MGHRTIVANPRHLPLIYRSGRKSDDLDAQWLARLARSDPELLAPLRHRGLQAQEDLAFLRSRDALVKTRTALINHARGQVKSFGSRLPKCSAPAFARAVASDVPDPLLPALEPILATIGDLTRRITAADGQVERLCKERYPETRRLRQVPGVGPITALAYVLTIEEPERFVRRRAVGAYVGLVPRRDQSGDTDKQLRITKAGDEMLRRLLVTSAHYILGPFGPPSALRETGERLAARGGKNAKKRAVVAVARKLAVVLHRLWSVDEPYDPFPAPVRRRGRRAGGKVLNPERG
jgi:transposase